MDSHARTAVRRSFANTRFEVLPLAGVEDQVAYLPPGATVTVTASPTRGLAPTIVLAERLAAQGLRVVPHLAARLVRDRAHLAGLLQRLEASGIRDVFVPAGDAPEPVGPYAAAVDLLRELADVGHSLDGIGITGYPESHAFIPDDETIRAMAAKAPYATHIVSQICYDPATIAAWVAAVRARGIELPIYVGVPGAVDRARLMRISLRVGLGDSVRFLRKQTGVVARLMAGYTPDDLVVRLAPLIADAATGLAGWHLFTFNEIAKTEQWRRQLLDLSEGAHA